MRDYTIVRPGDEAKFFEEQRRTTPRMQELIGLFRNVQPEQVVQVPLLPGENEDGLRNGLGKAAKRNGLSVEMAPNSPEGTVVLKVHMLAR